MPQAVGANPWDVVGGPEPMVPWCDADTSAAWAWTLRQRETGQTLDHSVRVSWRGFDSIKDVPSAVTREAYATRPRPGVEWFLSNPYDGWAEIIFHSHSRSPHGSTGRQEIIRLSAE